MKFDHQRAIYLQIVDWVKIKIVTSQWSIGKQVPSVRVLSVELGVTPNTVQRAYRVLEEGDLLMSKRGKGNFVTDDEHLLEKLRKQLANHHVSLFFKEMQELDYSDDQIYEEVTLFINEKERGEENE
ncbi:GntR family transcriptional regulator [Isobaculum melis]|uniref:DNA-binding transcriptional regulator YhcF, GntR family n=1 Tax=Isobaculum melis TaxID=142588 RepID=A0A1H9SVZ8_9LACT|nr:GntR family transcriptional regulator [Isobaculum melis]SER89101.1 DNA-binding transcriptional regulator YhcF, GntR family [Isobaculum melis]